MKPHIDIDIDRRAYLRGLCAGTALAGGTGIAAVGATGDDESRQQTDGPDAEPSAAPEHPAARPILWDNSDAMGFETVMHYDGDPAADGDGTTAGNGGTEGDSVEGDDGDDGREWVVHVTSESTPTTDYAAGLVNLRERADRTVTLGNARALEYDYVRGADHGGAVPDEVFLVLQTESQGEDGSGVALFKHVDDGTGDTSRGGDVETNGAGSTSGAGSTNGGSWQTLDVLDEMQRGDWRAIEIHDDPERMLEPEDDDNLGAAVGRTAVDLRDQETTVSDVVAEYGEDAEVVGVGFGTGNTSESTTVDVYYDDLFVSVPGSRPSDDEDGGRGPPDDEDGEDGEDGGRGPPDDEDGEGGGRGPPGDDGPGQQGGERAEYTFDFPAIVPMELSFEPSSVGPDEETTARLTFEQDEMGVDPDDLVGDSIALYPYSQAAPPLGEGVAADAEDVENVEDGFEVTFDGGDVADLDRLGTGEQSVHVAGQFDYEQVVWFLGEGTLSVEE